MLLLELPGELVLVAAPGAGEDRFNPFKVSYLPFDRPQKPVGPRQWRPLRQTDFEGELSLGQGRDQFGSQSEKGGHGQDHQQTGCRKDPSLVIERQLEPAGIPPSQGSQPRLEEAQDRRHQAQHATAQPLQTGAEIRQHHRKEVRQQKGNHPAKDLPEKQKKAANAPLGPGVEGLRRRFRKGFAGGRGRRLDLQRQHHGNEGERHQEGGRKGKDDGQGLVLEQLPRNAFHKDQGQEHRQGGQRRSRDRGSDFPSPPVDGFRQGRLGSILPMHRLQNHNGVVHQHAHTQSNPAQGHDVQGDIHLVHQGEGRQDGNGNGDGHQEGASQVAQEQVEDKGSQHRSQHRRPENVVHGLLDEPGLIENGADLEVLRQDPVLPQLLQLCLHGAGHHHRIGVALLVNRQLHALPAVDTCNHLPVLASPPDLRHLAQDNLFAFRIPQDDSFDLFHRAKLIQQANHVVGIQVIQAPGSLIQVLPDEHLSDFGNGDPQLRQPFFVDFNADLLLQAAHHLDGRDSFGGLQALLQLLVGQIAQPAEAHLTPELQAHDGIVGRIEAQQHRPLDVPRQLQQIQLFPDLQGCHVHVGLPGKLQNDLRLTRPRDRLHSRQASNHANHLLDGTRNQVFDLFRSRVLIVGQDGEGGIGNFRQQVEGHPLQGDQTEKGHRDHEHGDGHRTPNSKLDHGSGGLKNED